MSEDGEDGCEIARHHRERPRTPRSPRSVMRPPSTFEAEKSIYHSGCNPEQPDRSFRARTVTRGILKCNRFKDYKDKVEFT